jgi:hypothetical protein
MPELRISLTDKAIAQLPAPKDGWYLARDTELKGFFVVVGKRKGHSPSRATSGKEASALRRSGSPSAMLARRVGWGPLEIVDVDGLRETVKNQYQQLLGASPEA